MSPRRQPVLYVCTCAVRVLGDGETTALLRLFRNLGWRRDLIWRPEAECLLRIDAMLQRFWSYGEPFDGSYSSLADAKRHQFPHPEEEMPDDDASVFLAACLPEIKFALALEQPVIVIGPIDGYAPRASTSEEIRKLVLAPVPLHSRPIQSDSTVVS